MSAVTTTSGWDNVATAIEEVADRLRRATAALSADAVPYAVTGGNAVAEWVGRIDKGAVRFTQDIDILLQRDQLPMAVAALEKAGFVFRHAAGIDFFTDGPGGGFRDGVHILFAGERVREEYVAAAATIDETEEAGRFRVVTLQALVRMKLTSFRRKDQVHLTDLIDVGLIDATWTHNMQPELAIRLQQLLDDPDG